MTLDLESSPHFDPGRDIEPLDPAVAELRAAIGEAGAVLLCTPEYAGALPGSFKNPTRTPASRSPPS